MMTLTHTPEIDSYGLVAFVTFCFANFNFSRFLYEKIHFSRYLSFIHVYVLVNTLLVFAGFFLIPPNILFQGSWVLHLLSIPVGLLMGFFSVSLEKTLSRAHYRNKLFKRSNIHKVQTEPRIQGESKPINKFSLCRKDIHRRVLGLKKVESHLSIPNEFGSLFVIAITEELIFRGFLISILMV